MAKLSDNQVSAVAALNTLVDGATIHAADKHAWKAATPPGVTLVPSGMVSAGAVTEQTVAIRGKAVKVYVPVRKTAEVGGVDNGTA